MAGAAGKGEGKLIQIGDNRYGMPEAYDAARKAETLNYYKQGDSALHNVKAVYNGTGIDNSKHPQRKMNYGKPKKR
tara:strand:+ start:1521 stop:1748 length:228 start_codon:yes stop_codon:yes gene_type:complete